MIFVLYIIMYIYANIMNNYTELLSVCIDIDFIKNDMPPYIKKIAPAQLHLPKPGVHPLRAKLPWNELNPKS